MILGYAAAMALYYPSTKLSTKIINNSITLDYFLVPDSCTHIYFETLPSATNEKYCAWL